MCVFLFLYSKIRQRRYFKCFMLHPVHTHTLLPFRLHKHVSASSHPQLITVTVPSVPARREPSGIDLFRAAPHGPSGMISTDGWKHRPQFGGDTVARHESSEVRPDGCPPAPVACSGRDRPCQLAR